MMKLVNMSNCHFDGLYDLEGSIPSSATPLIIESEAAPTVEGRIMAMLITILLLLIILSIVTR